MGEFGGVETRKGLLLMRIWEFPAQIFVLSIYSPSILLDGTHNSQNEI